MTLQQIRQMPTTIETADGRRKLHESLLRSFGIVDKVLELCDQKVPHAFIVEVIADLRSAPPITMDASDPKFNMVLPDAVPQV